MSLEAIVFYLLLIDSIGANLMAWTGGQKWYQKNFRPFSCYFPASRGWTTYYFILVVLFGFFLRRQGIELF